MKRPISSNYENLIDYLPNIIIGVIFIVGGLKLLINAIPLSPIELRMIGAIVLSLGVLKFSEVYTDYKADRIRNID